MKIDKSSLDSLLSQNDDDFARTIKTITSKLGIEQNGVSPEKIRFFLRSMSENDLEKLLSSLGEERASEIFKTLKGGK